MNKKKKIGVSILGGTGFGAGELLRWLVVHPEVEVVSVVSTSMSGESIEKAHPHLSGFFPTSFVSQLDIDALLPFEERVVIAALPHGESTARLSKLMEAAEGSGIRIIDLSGDFRLQDLKLHLAYYPESEACEDIREKFVYGLPEKSREKIANAQFISNPGCYPTACALSVLPLVAQGYQGRIHFDAKSGTSGGGRAPSEVFHHPKRHASALPYKVLTHRHEPEINQVLEDPFQEKLQTTFVPQVIPVSRGILVTAHFELPEGTSTEALLGQYREFYKDAPFVRVLNSPPELCNVVGSNFCDVSVAVRGNQVIAMSVIDNLVKGMAGQAIQNMNIMCHLPECSGLWQPAFGII